MARPLLENGKKTKGRQRRENRWIENKEARQVTFSKRKNGLWKKASEIALLCRASIAIVVFSEAGRAFAFGSPSANAVLGCGGGGSDAPDWEALDALCRETKKKGADVKAEVKRMSAVGEKVEELKGQTGKRNWWEVDPDALGEAELPAFTRQLQRFRDNVRRRVEKLQSTTPPRRQAALDSAAAVE